jgi:hypothetical protein
MISGLARLALSSRISNVKCLGRVAQIGPDWEEKSTQAGGDVLTECSHHDGTTEERAAAL